MKSLKLQTLQEVPSFEKLKAVFPQVKALFFDMDGTLFNTEPHHAEAFLKMGQEFKIIPPHSASKIHDMLVGRADHLIFEIVKDWEGFPQHWNHELFVEYKNNYLLKILSKAAASSFFSPEIHNLLLHAKKENYTLGLVTSSEKVITHKLLEMTKISHLFNFVLTRDDCPFHKPHPWPYKKALEISNISAEEALIFEDSQVGVEAATNSGANVIEVKWHLG
jgi:beta-phosphoglucomutase